MHVPKNKTGRGSGQRRVSLAPADSLGNRSLVAYEDVVSTFVDVDAPTEAPAVVTEPEEMDLDYGFGAF